ncbi:MAG: ABC transporter ATP-binding protein/permease [Bacilli bacterium]|nr:ABC transporter ATP-binding protein/permease [Bacilli bacterium]
MLSLKCVKKVYQSQGTEQQIAALSGVSLSFADRGMVFILGKSGCGKSTFLNIIGGLDVPTEGEVFVDGISMKTFSPKEYDSYRNSYVGFVFQDFAIIDEFTVGQNVALALELQGKTAGEGEIDNVLSSLGLDGFADRKPSTLSGGQKQRVAIGRALVKKPRMILADEPTGSLDFESGRSVLSLLKKISSDRLVVVVSHDRDAAEEFGDRIIEFKDGAVINDRSLRKSQEEKSSEESNHLELLSSRLPISKGLKLGLSSVKRKPLRLISTILLSSISLSLFGLLSTLVLYDEATVRRDAALKLHCSSDLFKKDVVFTREEIEYDYLEDKVIKSVSGSGHERDMIAKEEVEWLNSNAKSDIDFAGVYGMQNYAFEVLTNGEYQSPINDKLYSCAYFSGFADCGHDYLERNDMPLLAGRYPVKDNEIAISSYHAKMIGSFTTGKQVSADCSEVLGTTIKIDFVSKGFDEKESFFTISGIYDTGSIDDYYVQRLKDHGARVDQRLFGAFQNYMKGSFHCLGYVSDSFRERYGEAFDESLTLAQPNSVAFSGIEISENRSVRQVSSDAYVGVLLPKFLNMDDFHFFDLNGNNVSYQEPKRNEVYVNASYYKVFHYSRLHFQLNSLLDSLSLAHESHYLPELDDFYSTENGEDTVEVLKAYLGSVDSYSFQKNIKSGFLADEFSYLIDNFGDIAFKRVYLSTLFKAMVDLNDRCGFGVSELSWTSDFYKHIGSYVLLPISAPSMDVFEECYEYIKNTPTLLEFANRVLCYICYQSFSNRNGDFFFNEIRRMMDAGQGNLIPSSTWDGLFEAYRSECDGAKYCYLPVSYKNIYCEKENISSFNWSYSLPLMSQAISYPGKLYYSTPSTGSGELLVKGVFEVGGERAFDQSAFFLNEGFINLVATCPRYINYTIIKSDYKGAEDRRYNYVITKSDFSVEQIKDICVKGKGFEFRFQNPLMEEVDFFIDQIRGLYLVFMIAAVVTGVFAGFLLATFVTSSIEYKKREIGIVRCLGGGVSDIFAIFSSESSLIALLAALLSGLFTFVSCQLLNGYANSMLEINILNYGITNLLIVVGLSILFAVISTFLPIWRKSSVPPFVALRRE